MTSSPIKIVPTESQPTVENTLILLPAESPASNVDSNLVLVETPKEPLIVSGARTIL